MKKIEEKGKHIDELSCGCGHCGSKRLEKKDKNSFLKNYWLECSKILVSLMLFVMAFFTQGVLEILLFSISAFIVGVDILISFVKNICKLNFFDENALMVIASITAFVLGEYFEGAVIIILYFIGEFLEKIATDNSRKKIAGLSNLKSHIVHLIDKNGMHDLNPENIEVGSLIEVKSGEMFPIDGILIGSNAEFDLKAITGESRYVEIESGKEIYSGSINVGNPVVVKTTKAYKDSTVEKIIEMVEGALSKKAKSQKFISSFSKIYTPLVFMLAVLISVFPPLFDQMNFIKWIYKALSFLVISCPCALVISVPLAFFVGIGGLARQGIMIKGSNYVEALSKVDTVVFDKTGTLTKGDFTIDKIESFGGFSNNQILDYAICLESYSNHPIAKAICGKNLKTKYSASNVVEIKGKGISGVVDNKVISIGNNKLMLEWGITVLEKYSGSVLYVSIENSLAGKIYLHDTLKENAKESILMLECVGVKKTAILSGDNEIVVKSVADSIGINEYYSQLLPSQKVEKFTNIKGKSSNLAMYVGDGINDSPVIALSDVGVAMGGLGSSIATNCADMVILDDNLEKVAMSIYHSKKVKRTVWTNIIFSLGVKFSIMILSLTTTMPVWLAMFSDVGVMLLAVVNSLRLGIVKNIVKKPR